MSEEPEARTIFGAASGGGYQCCPPVFDPYTLCKMILLLCFIFFLFVTT